MKRHPITKLSWAVQRRVSGEPDSIDCFGIERDIARHVKPLLDVGMGKIPHLYAGFCYNSQFPENAGDPKCPACRLLAEWRRPL